MKWKLYVENIYVYCNLFHQIEKKEKKILKNSQYQWIGRKKAVILLAMMKF